MTGVVHYRYHTSYDGFGIMVLEERWVAVKETAQGYWIVPEHVARLPLDMQHIDKKFVLKQSRIRFAYPDRQQAWNSFCIRRHAYERLLAWRAKCNAALVAVLPDEVPDREGYIGEGCLRYDSPKVFMAQPPDEQIALHFNIPLAHLTNLDDLL
jgi:hypothetical protein